MEPPLVVDESDSKWKLLESTIKLFDERNTKKIISKHGFKPLDKAVTVLKISIIAMFFSCEISYVVKELKNRADLRQFLHLEEIPNADYVYRFLSNFTQEQFIEMTLKILNSICGKRSNGKTIIIGDSTDISVDINWFRKKITKSSLENKDYKWGYSSSKGYYLGMKLVLTLEYPSLKPLSFLIYPGSPNDSKLFDEIVLELMNRRILRKGDTLVLDKGFYAYYNYIDGLVKYGIIPLIFPKKNFKLNKVLNGVILPLEFYGNKQYRIEQKQQFLRKIVKEFIEGIDNWHTFRPIRSMIEDVFKVKKNSLYLTKLHKYTTSSISKTCSLSVLLMGILISLGFNEKESLQSLAEW